MGLTIHYKLHFDGELDAARGFVDALYGYARTLEFDTVIGVEEANAPTSSPTPFNAADAPADLFILRLKSTAYIDGPYPPETEEGSNLVDVEPHHVIGFWVENDGAETALFGLARYPAQREIMRFGQPVTCETSLGRHWHLHSFCKTQYAGASDRGGEDHFLLAHTNVVRILDHAAALGATVHVHDDSEYWDHRDEARLLETYREWSSLIAAVAGRTKDRLGRNSVQGPILDDPAFEHLEAEGEKRWGAQLDAADRYIAGDGTLPGEDASD